LYLFPRAAPAQAQLAVTAEPLDFLFNQILPGAGPGAGQVESPAPTQARPLPPIAEAYFAVVWNLQGDPVDKARQFAAAVPPVELLTTHAELAAAFTVYGKADEDLKAVDLRIELECAGVNTDYCTTLLWEQMNLIVDRDTAQSGLYDRWLRACKPWQEYYEGVGAVFPYLPMQCKYP
jgi:hypothetical protein